MAVQARFWVTSVTRKVISGGDIMREVVLNPVVSPTQGNDDWSKYTPSGQIMMSVTTDAAGEWFEAVQAEGSNLAITFDRAPKAGA